MAEISGLSVRVSSSVAQFRAGMSSAQESAQDLSLSLRRLGQSSSSAERDLDSAGRSATTTAGQFTALTAGTNGLNASFMGLSVVTIGALIPSLLTLLTVVSPLVAALGGFVAIAGAIVGVGFAGALGAILTNTEILKEEFMDMLGVLERAFAPAIELATEVLLILIEEFQAIIPELVPTQQALENLAGQFADLGTAMIEALPGLVELAVTLTREFLPALIEFVDDVGPRLPEIVMAFVDSMREVGSILGPLGSELRDMLPVLNRFGTEVLRTIVPSLTRFTRMATNAMQSVNEMDSSLQGLVIGAVILLPIFTALAGFLGGPFTAALIGVGAAFAAVAGIIAADFGGIQGLMRQLAPAIRSVGNALQQSIGTFVENLDMATINKEFSEFESIVATQLQKNLPVARDLLQEFAQTLRDNQEEIGVLGSAAGTIIVGIIDLLGVLARIGGFVFRNVFAPGVSLVIDLIDIMLTKLANGVKLFNALQEGNFSQAAGFLEDVALGEDADVGQMAANAGMQQVGGPQGTQTVQILLEEDTEMMDAKIQEGAQNVLTEAERGLKRNSGSSPSP